MICNNCNFDNQPGALNCENCGAPLSVAPLADPGKTLNLVSLILGIAALVTGSICSCAFACLGGIVPMALGAVAIVLGVLGMKKSKAAGFKGTLGMVGMILGIAALVIIFSFIGINGLIGAMNAVSAPSYGYNTPYYY